MIAVEFFTFLKLPEPFVLGTENYIDTASNGISYVSSPDKAVRSKGIAICHSLSIHSHFHELISFQNIARYKSTA